MDAFNSLNVLPIYTSVAYQNSNKWYAFGNIWPLVSPTNSLLPFQFVVPYNITSASEVRIKNSNSEETYQSGITPEIDSSMYGSSGYSVVKVKEQTFPSLTLEEGRYYLEISISDGSGTYSFVSDIFTAVSDLSKYIKIEYWNDENLYYKGGEISYTNDFKFIMYVCSSIGKPEYEFEEELTERAGYKFLESQISNKLYKFTFVAPEFICDAMRLIRMSDYIVITSLGKKFNALTFSYEPEWEEQGDLASVEVEFTIDNIIQKLASFNRRQKQDFYNALLANEVEALKFDDESVAQYYKDFQQTYSGTNFIDGKLIRELDELTSLPEGKAYIAIDIGVGAARKIDISAILNLSDGSLYDKFISKEKPDGTNFLFNVGEYVDSIKDGKGIGLHPGGRAQLSILEARKQIQIGEAILFWDDVNKAIGIKRVAVSASEEGAEEIKESDIGIYSQGWMSAKGMGKGSESGGTGATTLGGLTNVGSWADQTAPYDRILVQLSGSSMWTEKKLSEIGGGLDEEQLSAYLTENNYAKKTDIPSLEGYATETWVINKGYITSAALTGYATQDWVLSKSYATTSDLDARIDALVNGAPAAFDTLKEIADVLEGNVDSIGDIITTLGTKADKTITITAGTGLTGGGNLSANRTISLATVGKAGTYTKVVVDAYGRVTDHSSLASTDIPTLSISKISGLQEELDSKLDADVLNDLFEKVEIRSGVYAIRAKYGLYSNEFISAKGMDEGEEGGGSGSSYLSDLLDVSLTSLAANDLLKWNGTKWVNVPMSSIAGSSSWNEITGTPTTLSGYGITDAYKVKAGSPDDNKGMCAGYYANVGSYASFVQSNFGGQLSFGAGGVLRYRGINNNYAGEWKTVVDTSVYTAKDILEKLKTVDGADSGLDADTLDGYEASKFYANGYVMFGHTIDATSLNENTYYPVTFYLGSSRNVRIECFVSLSSNSKPSWATHQNGFSVKKIWETNGNAWGTINVTRRILASDYLHATSDPVRGIGQMLNSSNEYVYVRGGGRYFFYVSNNITPVLRTSAYTASQETISPTTSAPAEIVRNVAFKTDAVAAADKLTTNAGSNINPIYFTSGVPKASSYSFGNASGNIPISNGTLCANLNADKVDGVDVTVNSSATGIKKLYVFNYVGNQNTYIKLGTLPTVATTGSGTSKAKFRIYGGINFGGREEATWEVIASTRGTIYVNSTLVNGAKQLKIGYVSTSSGVEIWAALDDNYATKTAIEIEVSEQFTVAMTRQTTKPSGFTEGSYRLLLATGTDGILSVNGIKDVERITFAEGDSGRKTVITNGGSFMLYAATSGWAGGVSYYSNDGSTSLGTAAGGYGSGNVLNYYFYGGAYNSPKMVILSSGNVGIGTTAPTQKLHVAGNILATGAITAKAVSDIRLKTVIQEKVDYRKKLLGLGSVVDFRYNDLALKRETGAVDEERHIGLIYQQAKTSKLVNFCHEDEDGYGSINYLSTDYINLIAGALQQTIRKQETIEQRVARLERENKELKQQLNKLSA